MKDEDLDMEVMSRHGDDKVNRTSDSPAGMQSELTSQFYDNHSFLTFDQSLSPTDDIESERLAASFDNNQSDKSVHEGEHFPFPFTNMPTTDSLGVGTGAQGDLNSADVKDLHDGFGASRRASLASESGLETEHAEKPTTSRRSSARSSLDLTKSIFSPARTLYSEPTTAVTAAHHIEPLSSPSSNEVTKSTLPTKVQEQQIREPEDPIFYFDPAGDTSIEEHTSSPVEDASTLILQDINTLEDVFHVKAQSPSKDLASSPIDICSNLAPSLFAAPFLHRRFTAPEKSYLSVQERRQKSLRNRHMNAVPLSRMDGANALQNASEVDQKENSSPKITYPARERQMNGGLASVSENGGGATDTLHSRLTSPLASLPANLSRGNYSSLQASLRQRRSPSVENSSYIEHLEGQVADLTSRLKSYTSPASEKSHAAVVQRLNNKVRSLENQLAEWENVFDDRVRENERVHAETERLYINKLKSLREQVQLLEAANLVFEEDLDKERKENVSLRLEVTEMKALALDNAKLAEALKATLTTIEKMEQDHPRMEVLSIIQPVIAAILGDELKEFSEADTSLLTEETAVGSPYSAMSDLHATNDSANDTDYIQRRARNKQMRRFPSGVQPTPLILSTPVTTSPPSLASRRSSADTLSSEYRRNSNRWSISKETPITESESLFAELAKAQNDGLSESDEDDNEPTTQDESCVSSLHSRNSSTVRPIRITSINKSPIRNQERFVQKLVLDELTDSPSSPTDTETASESSSTGTSFSGSFNSTSSSPPTSPGLSNLLFAPIRLTSSVITNVGYGILHPQQAIRDASKMAMETFMETGYVDVDIPADTRTYIPNVEDFVDESVVSRGNGGKEKVDFSKPTTEFLNNLSNIMQVTTPVSRRGTIRQSMLKEFILKAQDLDHIDSDAQSREQYLAQTMGKLCSDPASTSDADETPKARKQRMPSSSPESASEADSPSLQSSANSRGQRRSLRLDTAMPLKRPFLPIKPSASGSHPQQRDFHESSHSRRVSLPPPYTEHPERDSFSNLRHRQPHRNHRHQQQQSFSSRHHPAQQQQQHQHQPHRRRQYNMNRDSLDLAWSSCSSENEQEQPPSSSLIIPESELARVLKKDISNGSLMHAMGLTYGSPVVLWTKLILSFMITMFVAVRDGPDVALEHIDWSKQD